MNRLASFLLINLLLCSVLATAKPLSKEQVPEPLKPWIAWVTQDNPELYCPFLYNSPEQKRCSWPTGLALSLSAQEGRFSQRWQVYKDSWVSLPGDSNIGRNKSPSMGKRRWCWIKTVYRALSWTRAQRI